jgi:zinc protease
MIDFERFELSNGLRILVNTDKSTPLAAVNLLYDVGARDEHPDRTGFAHLFEHLMFEGSKNIPAFDEALQMAGGENNAFTSNDITNYYITIPAQNLETAFWLESDRMLELAFSEEKLAIQKNVVTEEYRQSYLNQPYGDVWMLLRSLVYKVHPYQWPTIGRSIEHIQNAELDHVKDFFYRFYRPNNAILTVTGNVEPKQIFELAGKWFGDIPAGIDNLRELPVEPEQKEGRVLKVTRDVPFDEIYISFPTGRRLDTNYFTTDLLSDILAGGRSGRLQENLVKKRKIFSEANAWITGSIDKGFFSVMGKLHKGESVEEAESLLWKELNRLKTELIPAKELEKVKNKVEAGNTFAETGILSRAMNLAFYELLGDANMVNHQNEPYFKLSDKDLQDEANEIFRPEKVSVLNYMAG